MLVLLVFVAEANAAARCRLWSPAVLLLAVVGSGGGTAVNSVAATVAWLPLLIVPGTLFFCSIFFLLSIFLQALLPHTPTSPNFGGVACRVLFIS